MFVRYWDVVAGVWEGVLLGTALMLVATGAGWAMAQSPSLLPVRLCAWWVRRVVLPLVDCRSSWFRASAIFSNNASILALLVAVGRWPVAPILMVGAVGTSLGIALRVMSDRMVDRLPAGPPLGTRERWRVRVGVAFNLLEVPAIMLTVGLSLGRRAVPLQTGLVWEAFAVWILPATLLAAAGESLWLGVGRRASDKPTGADRQDHKRDHDQSPPGGSSQDGD